MSKLTQKRAAILSAAAKNKNGVVTNPFIFGFERVTWGKSAQYLVSAGLLTPYRHGGFEITDEGRAKIAETEA